MKIDKVLHASDDNKTYLDFWPVVSKLWAEVFRIKPVLLYFGDKDVDDTYGEIIRLKGKHENHLNTLCSRYWFPSTEPETTFMISDIDMLPMSKFFFIDQIKDIDSEKYVHLSGHFRPIPSCYHIAKGKNFKDVLGISGGLDDYIDANIRNHAGGTHGVFDNQFKHWGTDEHYGTSKIEPLLKTSPDKFVILNREPIVNRLDRSNWSYSEEGILQNKYYDCHSIRPYLDHKQEIDKVVELIGRSYE